MLKPNLPEFELRILNHLWRDETLTARQLTDLIYPNGTHASYTTVKKLLERLESKGFVERSGGARGHIFTATVDRETIVAGELGNVVDRFCEGSIAPVVNALTERIDLTQSQRDELSQLISDFQKKQSKRPTKRK